ncbi:uncharacterized protein At3g49140-like isoform X1 [Cucurbita pepo subsp. pepo]|uniref:uncharacterized protein At3g49140-like isoform X1 n=1 Tax=Cucurbita pepo subsp. pepo TaxID=3664 RepID=UPI000C9D401D|nr:uncharacterized protein At3g49140-like isoform X1 [Cucurbita pepo subsp. pepo]
MIETALAVRFPAGANFCYSSALSHHRSAWTSEDVTNIGHASGFCRLLHSCASDVQWKRCRSLNSKSFLERNNFRKNGIHASAEHLGSASDPIKQNRRQYHPSEELVKSRSENAEDVRPTAAETSRTIIEVNSKATLMFVGLINDEVQENIIWPELPYVTDEHGNIYFQVKNTEEAMQNLTSENNFVQVLIGIDTMEMIDEINWFGPSEVDLGFEELDDEALNDEVDDDDGDGDGDGDDEDDDDEDDADDDYDADWVSVIEDEDDPNHSDETAGDWAKLETMRSSHPMHFAKKLSEAASDDPIDWMEQPPATLVIQGALRPTRREERSVIQRHLSSRHSSNSDINEAQKLEDNLENHGRIDNHGHESSSSNGLDDNIPMNEVSFYRLEMTKVQLFTGHSHPSNVEIEDLMQAQPDAIAHSAEKIISRLREGGEKTTQALKSLCWRCKGIQVEEAVINGIDSIGFDVRVCSGTQVQTLRFAFDTRATSELSAEKQLNDLLFQRMQVNLF